MQQHFLLNNQFLFNHQYGRLHDLKARTEVQLRSNEWKLLYFFVTHPGEDLSTDNILSAVWEQVRSKSNVTTTVKKLRQHLEDNPDSPRFIQTQVMKGYAFIGDVSALTAKEYDSMLASSSKKQQRLLHWWQQHYQRTSLFIVNIICLFVIYLSLLPVYNDSQLKKRTLSSPSVNIIPMYINSHGEDITNKALNICQQLATNAKQTSSYYQLPIAENPVNHNHSLMWSSSNKEMLICQLKPTSD